MVNQEGSLKKVTPHVYNCKGEKRGLLDYLLPFLLYFKYIILSHKHWNPTFAPSYWNFAFLIDESNTVIFKTQIFCIIQFLARKRIIREKPALLNNCWRDL